jgi:hypothetical protein
LPHQCTLRWLDTHIRSYSLYQIGKLNQTDFSRSRIRLTPRNKTRRNFSQASRRIALSSKVQTGHLNFIQSHLERLRFAGRNRKSANRSHLCNSKIAMWGPHHNDLSAECWGRRSRFGLSQVFDAQSCIVPLAGGLRHPTSLCHSS